MGAPFLKGWRFAMKSYNTLRFETLSSTNDYVKTHLDTLDDHTLVVAGFQTGGRGRRERRWVSAADKNFLGTFYSKATSITATRSMMTGVVAVVEALDTLGVKACIKPPNDVYVEGRKIAGILAEIIHDEMRHVIMGVGLNVNEAKDGMAISLYDLTKRQQDLKTMTDLIKSSVESTEMKTDEAIFRKYIRHIPFGRISAQGQDVQGELEAIDPSFVCTVDGRKVPCGSLTFKYK